MGVGVATALSRLVLMMQEYKALGSTVALAAFKRRFPFVRVHLLRYIDDVRIIVVHPRTCSAAEVATAGEKADAIAYNIPDPPTPDTSACD